MAMGTCPLAAGEVMVALRLSGRFYFPDKIIDAAFSAIINVGALVLPEMMLGIIEASATRSPSNPRTRSRGSTTDISSMPILQEPTG